MKRLFLAFALLPAVAFAQQTPNLSPEQLAALVAQASAPDSGNFPASCSAPMAKYQISQALQQHVGNPSGDVLTDLDMGRQVGAITEKSYSCIVTAIWRDHGMQHGMFTFIKAGNGVMAQWQPFGY